MPPKAPKVTQSTRFPGHKFWGSPNLQLYKRFSGGHPIYTRFCVGSPNLRTFCAGSPNLQAALAINVLHLRDVALATATASRDARCLYVISIGSTRSLYINMDQLTSTSPLPVTTQTTTLETTLRPEKRPIGSVGGASHCSQRSHQQVHNAWRRQSRDHRA